MQPSYWRRQKPPPVRNKTENEEDMDALDNVMIGMTAEKTVTVTSDMTVGHFVAQMPQVYATPMMILHMEMASGSAIAAHLPKGFVSVGMDVKVRHLAATPVGRKVRAISRVVQIDPGAWCSGRGSDGDRKIGDGTHAASSTCWSSRSGSGEAGQA
jgi:predicted thioesterase